jgi:hypothetical protein
VCVCVKNFLTHTHTYTRTKEFQNNLKYFYIVKDISFFLKTPLFTFLLLKFLVNYKKNRERKEM